MPSGVPTPAKDVLKKITIRVHPLTYGHLVTLAHSNEAVRRASVSAEVAKVLEVETARLPEQRDAVVPDAKRAAQVMACVHPKVYAALIVEYARRLKEWDEQGAAPSLSSVAGALVDRWFFSDKGRLPYRMADAQRKREAHARHKEATQQ